MNIERIKQPKKLTARDKAVLIKAVRKTVSQYKVTLELLAKT